MIGMKHDYTSGPWGVVDFALFSEVVAMGNKLIAVVQSRNCDSPEEMRANARLIASAPEMKDAIEELKAKHFFNSKIFGLNCLKCGHDRILFSGNIVICDKCGATDDWQSCDR